MQTAAAVRRWSTSDDLWLRRLAILGQLGRKDRVDLALLADLIEPNVADTEFFIRKAIGWALREWRASTRTGCGPSSRSTSSARLSRREALKHL